MRSFSLVLLATTLISLTASAVDANGLQGFDALETLWSVPTGDWAKGWINNDGSAVALLANERPGETASIRLFDGKNGTVLGEMRGVDSFQDLRFSPDSRFVLATGFRSVQIFDLPNKAALASWEYAPVDASYSGRLALRVTRFSPNGRFAVTGSDADRRIYVYDFQTRPSSPLLLEGDLARLSLDGRYLAFRTLSDSGRENYRIYDLEAGEVVAGVPAGPKGFAGPGFFAPQGYSFAAPTNEPGIQVLDQSTGTVRGIRLKTPARRVGFSPNGKHLVFTTTGGQYEAPSGAIFDLATLRPLIDLKAILRGDSLVEPFEFDATGRWLVITARPDPNAAERIRLFDLQNPRQAQLVVTLPGRWPMVNRHLEDNHRLSSDGQFIYHTREVVPAGRASVVPDCLLGIFDLDSRTTSALVSPSKSVQIDDDVNQYFRVLDLPKVGFAQRFVFAGFTAALGPSLRYVMHDRQSGHKVAEWAESNAEVLSLAFDESAQRTLFLVKRTGNATRTASTTLYTLPITKLLAAPAPALVK